MQIPLGSAQPTDYFLDHFVAHKISELKTCGAPEIPGERSSWLNSFILGSVVRFKLPATERAFASNFLRRTENTLYAYREGRGALLEYLGTPRTTISPYFQAILNFEVCISQCYQGFEMLMTASGELLFKKHETDNVFHKLNTVYVDSKHMNLMIRDEKIPADATAGIWITNDGLESSRGGLSFSELGEIFETMRGFADKISTLGPPAPASDEPPAA